MANETTPPATPGPPPDGGPPADRPAPTPPTGGIGPDEAFQLRVGMPTDASDGPWGELDDIVVDPVRWRVTHLVVQPRHHHERSHLVPVETVASSGDRLVLSCSSAEIDAAPRVQATDFVPLDAGADLRRSPAASRTPMVAWPYWPSSEPEPGPGHRYGHGSGGADLLSGLTVATIIYDRVPEGTVEIRRASKVLSGDGHIVGHVDGFIVNPGGAITHLVLRHGHFWGHREVTIPLADVERAVPDMVHLRGTRDEIGQYPSVPFQRRLPGAR